MKWISLLLLAISTTACTPVRVVSLYKPVDYTGINEATQGRKLVIRLRDRQEVQARSLELRSDSTEWIEWRSRKRSTVATTDVLSVTIRARGQTAAWLGLAGAGFGTAVGLGAGGELGSAVAFVGVPVFGIAGYILGALFEQDRRYMLHPVER